MATGLRRDLAALIAAVAAAGLSACAAAPAPETPVPVTIATGGPGGAFYPIGKALAALYAERLPAVESRILTGGSTQNLQAVESGRAVLGFTQADVAYVAYRRGTDDDARPYSSLRGVALLWLNTVHVAVPRGSPIGSVGGLAGRRVAVGTAGSGTETLARIVLESHGLSYRQIQPAFLSFVDTIDRLRAGALDAALIVAGLPADAVTDLGRHPGVRLLPIPRDQVKVLRSHYPFLQPVVVPAGTYPGVAEDVESVGVSSLLVTRSDQAETLIHRLTRELFDALPHLHAAHPAARLIDPEQAPATPIPLHPGAARYYRERQVTQ